MHIPRIAAGQNLAFWPVGHIFRKSGAFFIRRSFKGAKLYAEVFARYIKALLEEGHPIEFYIEGGRSRNGKLVLPKIGFLSILFQAYREGYCKDLIFVPTSIIYDRIIEENSYLKEIGGGSKEKENIKQVFRARRFLKKRYGKIYIRFNEPVSLNEYLSQEAGNHKDIHNRIAFHLVDSINKVSLVTPLSLVSTAILTNHRKGFYASELEETVNIFLEFIKRYNIPLADTFDDPSKAVLDSLSLLTSWKIIEHMEDVPEEEEEFYFLEDDKKLELEYYKNSIIHFFIHHSFIAISLLTGIEEEKSVDSISSDYRFLKSLLEKEFIFNQDSLRDQTDSIIGYFLDSGYLESSDGNAGYKITRLGFDKLPMWAALTKTFVESYWITAKTMGQEKFRSGTDESLLRHISYLGKRYHRMGMIEHIEALSQLNFKNAIKVINKRILNGAAEKDNQGPLEFSNLPDLTSRLYDLSHYGQ